MSKKSIITVLSMLGIFTFASINTAEANVISAQTSTAYGLGTGFLDHGKTANSEYQEIMASLSANEKAEFIQVQDAYLDEMKAINLELNFRQTGHNVAVVHGEGQNSAVADNAKRIASLHKAASEKTAAFKNYVEENYAL